MRLSGVTGPSIFQNFELDSETQNMFLIRYWSKYDFQDDVIHRPYYNLSGHLPRPVGLTDSSLQESLRVRVPYMSYVQFELANLRTVMVKAFEDQCVMV